MKAAAPLILAALTCLVGACHENAPKDSLVLTQIPVDAAAAPDPTVLDLRYPPGSRIVLITPPFTPETLRVLSTGLEAAGDPCVSFDGLWAYFSGKDPKSGIWQIYRVRTTGGGLEQMTHVAGGAMDPAVAAHAELVFSAPVPKAGTLWHASEPASLYGELPGEAPRRLTFATQSAVNPAVLRDGRILYVSASARTTSSRNPHLCLYTINNDGTEATAYAGQDDGVAVIRRPRELGDGRIAFLASRQWESVDEDWAEGVRSAAPFATRAQLFAFQIKGVRSVEPAADGSLLVCAETRGTVGRSMSAHSALYRMQPMASSIGSPLFDDPQWDTTEATAVTPREEPAGHTSAVMAGANRGTMLCLNVNDSCEPALGDSASTASALRITAALDGAKLLELGTVPVAADGSVLVRLPAGVPLGFDTLDASGHVLRHQPPVVWLQPGENRACVGCHERRNHAPRNVRPIAVQIPPQSLELPQGKPAQ